MRRWECLLFVILLLGPALFFPQANAVGKLVPIGNGLTKVSGILFHPHPIEQNQSIVIQYGYFVNSSNPYAVYRYVPGNLIVTVTTPSGKQYTFSNIYHIWQWTYPDEFGGSTAEAGSYTVHVSTIGLVQPGGIPVQDEQDATFVVVQKNVPSPLLMPALSIVVLGVVGLVGFGFLARAGLVRQPKFARRLQLKLGFFKLLLDARILVPLSLLVIAASSIAFPFRIIPIFVLTFFIIVAWAVQTLFSMHFYFEKLLPEYVKGSALYIFGWMSVALHEISHAIVNLMGGVGIEEINVSPFEGSVKPRVRDTTFRTWFGLVFGGLAPAYLIPAILLLLWFIFAGIALNLPYTPPTLDMFTPFNQFGAVAFVNFFYWVVINYANPLMYVFMYFLITSSISAGPSLPDWSFAWHYITAMPKHTLTFILGFFSIMCLLAVFDYSAVISFFGFWVLLFAVIVISQIIALIFTRLTMAQGIGFIVLAIVVNVLAGYTVTVINPEIRQFQCTLVPSFCSG